MMSKIILYYIALRTVALAFTGVRVFGRIQLTDIVGILFPLVALPVYFLSRKTIKIPMKWVFTLLIIWVLFTTINEFLFYKPNVYWTLKQWPRLLNACAAFLIFPIYFRTEQEVRKLINAFMIATIFPLCQVVLMAAGWGKGLGLQTEAISSADPDLVMFEGTYGNYGVFAVSSLIGLLGLIYRADNMVHSGKVMRAGYVLAIFAYLAMGVSTLSRTLLIVLCVVVSILLYQLLTNKRILVIIIFLVFGVSLTFTGFVQNRIQGYEKRSALEFQVLEGNRSIEAFGHGRVGMWKHQFDKFFNKNTIMQQTFGTGIDIGPHGDYIYFLFRYGYVGLMLYMILMFGIFFKVYRKTMRVHDRALRSFGITMVTATLSFMVYATQSTMIFGMDIAYFVLGGAAVFLCADEKTFSAREAKIENHNSLA